MLSNLTCAIFAQAGSYQHPQIKTLARLEIKYFLGNEMGNVKVTTLLVINLLVIILFHIFALRKH